MTESLESWSSAKLIDAEQRLYDDWYANGTDNVAERLRILGELDRRRKEQEARVYGITPPAVRGPRL